MAILFGTQSNGETLPVLVDQFGNLLAKGIDGAPGQEGPPGPPGVGELPADPYEGALLGWLNGGLAWIGTPPVPIPDDVFGPITGWDSAGLLTVEGGIPTAIKQGVYVYQCNPDGSIFVDGWNNSEIWSNNTSNIGGFNPGSGILNLFDGDLTNGVNGAGPTATNTFTVEFNPILNISTSLNIYFDKAGRGYAINQTTGNAENLPPGAAFSTGSGWSQVPYTGALRSIHFFGNVDTNNAPYCAAIELNGQELVDAGEYPSAPNLNFRVQSVSGQNLIGTANRTDNFSIGKYLRVPQQNVARWLYDGNLNKVITSTGIDISRLTEI